MSYFDTGLWWAPIIELMVMMTMGIYLMTSQKHKNNSRYRFIGISLVIPTVISAIALAYLIAKYEVVSGWGGATVWMLIQVAPIAIVGIGFILSLVFGKLQKERN